MCFDFGTNRRLGRGIAYDPSRFATPMRHGDMNYDRIGYIGRLREQAKWDPESHTFRGGLDTPASRIMLSYGEVANARFAVEDHDGETLGTR